MIKIAICDDDIETTSNIEDIMYIYANQHNIDISCDIFFDGQEMVQYIEEQNLKYDVIFLDIEMKYLNGMEAARKIRENDKMVILIFVTSHSDYAIEAYDVHPFQFIVKPIDERIVNKYFQQASELITAGDGYFEYSYNKEYYRLLLQDIVYFESDRRKICIYLKDGSYRQYYDKISNIEKKLKDSKLDFWRIHQSILVNSRYIFRKAFDHIELQNGQKLSISEGKRKELNLRYVNMLTKNEG